MDYQEQLMQKLQQQQAEKYTNQPPAYGLGDSMDAVNACCGSAERKVTERERAEKNFGHHSAEINKADRAIAFYREHPEFDEFVQLLRAGVIQI